MRHGSDSVEFRILGPLEVLVGGRLVDPGGPRQRTVLGVLLLAANEVVSVDRLADAVWEGNPPPGAVGTLQAYISNLRRVLEPERSARQPPRLLLSRAPGYVLQVQPSQVDAANFEMQATEGRRLLGAGQPHAARNTLAQALELWRGPALADFAYDSFAHAESTRLEELRNTVLEHLIEAELASGAHVEALPRLEALVVEHPTRERLWEQLMLALYRAGRQSDALTAFKRAQSVLREELGLDPGPALRRLEKAILNHDPNLLLAEPVPPVASSAAGPLPPPSVAAGDVRPSGSPFVGRETELAELKVALDDAVGGSGGVVLVGGDAGIGKTRLAQELEAHARQRDVTVVWGRAYEGAGAPAFWPWVQILRRLLLELDRERVAIALRDLTELVPEVAEALPAPMQRGALSPEGDRFRVFDATTRVLSEHATRRTLVIILDDLHWADPASLQLLEFLVPFIGDARLLIVGTYRDREVTSAFQDVLGMLARQTNVRRLAVAPLSRVEVERLVSETLQAPADTALVDVLHARTQGNPFFAAELLQLFQAGDLSSVRDEVPVGVRDVIHHRVSRLPIEAQHVVATAAVIGREFHIDDLAAACGQDQMSVRELLEPILATGMVQPRRPDAMYQFSHSLVREAIYDQLGSAQRVRMHRQVGETLEATRTIDDSRAGELAHHFDRAGVPDKAVLWLFESGRRARRAYLNDEAADRLVKARTWLGRVQDQTVFGKPVHELAFELNEELGDALRAASRHAHAREAYRAAVELAGESSWRTRARLERKIGVTLGSEGRFDAALDAYASAEQLLNHDPVHDRAWWEEWLEAGIEDMWIHYQAANWREMQRQAERLQPAAEQHGSPAQQVGLQRTLGAMVARRDRYVIGHDALRHSRAALAIAEEACDEVLQGSCWFSLGFALLWHGSVDQAEEALLRALELCGRTRDVTTETACWVYLAVAARLRRDVPLTRERATAGLRAATATGSRPYTAAARANLAWVAIREGANEDAARLAGEALETWEFSPVVHAFHWQAIWPLLKLAVDSGQAGDARALAQRLLAPDQQPPPPALATLLEDALKEPTDATLLRKLRRVNVEAETYGLL